MAATHLTTDELLEAAEDILVAGLSTEELEDGEKLLICENILRFACEIAEGVRHKEAPDHLFSYPH